MGGGDKSEFPSILFRIHVMHSTLGKVDPFSQIWVDIKDFLLDINKN